MIRKFRSWLRNWLFTEEADDDGPKVRRPRPINKAGLALASPGETNFATDPIRLYIYPASGGFVIETKTYDEKKDRHNSCLYINTDHETLGEEIGKIITIASLSR